MFKGMSAVFAFGLLFFLFQNCSKKTFSTKNSESLLSVESNNENQLETPNDNPQSPEELDENIITTPPKEEVMFTSCQSFQELIGDSIVVPARTANNICYYVRLMSALPNARTGSRGEPLASDVVARMHAQTDGNTHPYVLGLKEITQLQLLGARNVALSGSFSNAQATMSIDNFFLIEQSTEVGSFRAWAYGTADSVPANGKITVGQFVVDNFYAFAPSGTAQVTAIDMTSAIPAGLKMSIRFRGLDCGVSAQASDVFMVFH